MYTLTSTGSEQTLAVIKNTDIGTEILIPWKELEPYWSYSNFDECDYSGGAVIDDHLVLCLTTAGGQGGIVAIKNLIEGSWIYIAKADFIQAALPLFEHGIILIKSFVVPNYGNAGRTGHFIEVARLDGQLEAWEDRSRRIQIDTQEKWVTHPLSSWNPRFEVDRKVTENMTVGLYYDPLSLTVHIIDGEHFYGQVSTHNLETFE
jgi:hypothetical protein